MRFTEFFIRRAITTTLLISAIAGFGLLSYLSLPVSNLPEVEYPTIHVSAALPGTNPDTMAATVATPLESEFSRIPGIENMTSSSTVGDTQITLQFALNRSVDAAAQDVQAAISRAAGSLPPGMPDPPSYSKVNPADDQSSGSRCTRRRCRLRIFHATRRRSSRNKSPWSTESRRSRSMDLSTRRSASRLIQPA